MKTNTKLAVLACAAVITAVSYTGYRYAVGVEAVNVDATEQWNKIAEYANPEAFITPLQLSEMMREGDDVVVIGALNPSKGDKPIMNSFTFWRPDYSAAEDAYPYAGMRAQTRDMEELVSTIGATANSTIVVYAANDHHDAARLYWQLSLLGNNKVKYLDGGLNAWVGAGLPTGNANPAVERTDYKAPAANHDMLATFEMVQNAIESDDWVIIDTRGSDERDGTVTLSGAYGPGAIPTSQFINWSESLNEDTTLKTAGELRTVYGDLIAGKKVISYCQSGVRSAHTAMVLKEVLGAEDVYNYDGSWIEWSYMFYEDGGNGVTVINGDAR